MCGDIECWSCGPAQGNSKCILCGRWLTSGDCPHANEDGTNYLPEYVEAAELRAREDAEIEAMIVRDEIRKGDV